MLGVNSKSTKSCISVARHYINKQETFSFLFKKQKGHVKDINIVHVGFYYYVLYVYVCVCVCVCVLKFEFILCKVKLNATS